MPHLFKIEFRYNETDEWMTDCTFAILEEAVSYLELMEKQFGVMTTNYVAHRLVIGF